MSFKSLEGRSLTPAQVSIGLTLLQCVVAVPVLMRLRQETATATSQEMSRSAGGVAIPQTLPAKIANLIIYGPSAGIAYWASTTMETASKLPKLLFVHFGKRAVELFVLQPSQKMPDPAEEEMVPTVAAIETSVFYSLGSYLLLTQTLPVPDGVDYGQIVFWLGQLGAGFHSYLLETNKQRGLPKYGLFCCDIAAPHHLCEIAAWMGLARYSRNRTGYVQAGLVAVLLAYQAKKLNDKYPDLEGARNGKTRKRWNLIPYIY